MIPRVRPSYSTAELRAALAAAPRAVGDFEAALARHFGLAHAIAFPYGRSAIYGALRAAGRVGDVVQPAYNCVVVAHATMGAGCRPVFVDVQTESPNQDPEAMLESIDARTVAVVPTSTFGFGLDAASLCDAIRRRNREALILVDCCQAFDARWKGELLAAQGDAAILAFGIGKPMTTLFGGALLTNRNDLAQGVRRFRDGAFASRGAKGVVARWMYFLASWVGFSSPLIPLTDFLENGDTALNRYLKRLRARDSIRLPQGNTVLMSRMEAAIGGSQLRRAPDFIRRRREIAAIYARELRGLRGLELLDWPEGSTYAIYAARVSEPAAREPFLASLRAQGVQGDRALEYVVPALECYREAGLGEGRFPNATRWSQSVVNLPSHPTLGDTQVMQVVRAVQSTCARSGAQPVAGAAAA